MIDDSFDIKEEGDYTQGIPNLKEIALMHIRKISGICCSEFTKGYWEERPIKIGSGISIAKTYHPDQRAVFCNAVNFLLWVVYPNSDEKFQTKYKDIKLITKDTEEKTDWEKSLESAMLCFQEINAMFQRTKYFDNTSGKTERH